MTSSEEAQGERRIERADESKEREARWAAVGSRERADWVLLRARLADLAREGEREGDLERMPSLQPLAALVERLREMATRRDVAEGVERAMWTLADDDALRAGVRRYVARVARSARATAALADLGIFPAHGLGAEVRERLVSRVLPSHRPPEDLAEILGAVFCSTRDDEWLARVPDDVLARLLRVLTPDDELARGQLEIGLLRAIDLLSHRLAAAGEDPLLHWFDPDAVRHDSPFLAQAHQVLAATASRRARLTGEAIGEAGAEASGEGQREEDGSQARVLLSQCEDAVSRIRRRAPRTGATLRLGYELARIEDLVTRLRLLLDALSPTGERAWAARAGVLRALVRAQRDSQQVGPLLARASQLAAAEVVSRAGVTGEHYITRTPVEYGRMWLAAMGAGAIVAVLAAIKVGLAALHAPPLVEATLFSANYAIGFVVVHLLGLTIATKQPAMTAATLARSIDDAKPRETRPLVETVMRLVRSQLAAIAGNVIVALPVALAIALALGAMLGAPIAGPEKAQAIVREIDPLRSPALFHAAITGVWLTLSGIVAGYATSAVAARHVRERLERSAGLRRWIGPSGVERLARRVETSAGPIAGSIVLGVLLGSTGTLGEMIGLPIDIRHVSFSSANLGIAAATLGTAGIDHARAALGLATIGAANLGVSFGLSLGLALHAHRRTARELAGVARDLGRSVLVELPAWLLPLGPSARAPQAAVSPPSSTSSVPVAKRASSR